LTASYAGKSISAAVNVVRPENLPVASLQIVPVDDDDPCAQHLVAGTSQDFAVSNPNVILDQTGLAFAWAVKHAAAAITDAPTLTIDPLPAAGSRVSVRVSLSNASGITAHGSFEFKTVKAQSGFREQIRRLNCSLRQLKAIQAQIPQWASIQESEVVGDPQLLATLEKQVRRMSIATEAVMKSIKSTRSSSAPRGAVSE
jgi:hypothetical protein